MNYSEHDDDFASLVSRSNPAAQPNTQSSYRQAGPSTPIYPPSQRQPQPAPSIHESYTMDPFFDDEDEQMSPNAGIGSFNQASSRGAPRNFIDNDLDSTTDLPLTKAAVAPAGTSISDKKGLGGQGKDWTFDDDETPTLPHHNSFVSHTAPPVQRQTKTRSSSQRTWKWPWEKQKLLAPERKIWLNDRHSNEAEGYCSNYVSTSKYNVITFLPKFIGEQFSKYANVFFLFTACIQQIPGVSPTNKWTTIVPLGLVLLASAFKETEEDLKRHQSDAELNARKAKVLVEGGFIEKRWRDIAVGDVVRIESNDFIPADVLLISSSEPEGLCYIETSNLDGETNLKIKQASTQTAHMTSPHLVQQLTGFLRSEQPNNSLYTYEGTLVMTVNGAERQVPMSPEQVLLRGAQLRNTPWAYGLVVFTGHETKLMRNATATPVKRTAVEKQVNVQIVFLFILLIVLSLISTVGASIRSWFFSNQEWYLDVSGGFANKVTIFVEDILTFVILYNNLIPISLIVTMEVVKFQQAQLINSDLDMYYAKTDTPALCRTSSLVEELGQIEYIFSDKTGTLTRNEMEFRACSVAGVMYAEAAAEGGGDERGGEGEGTKTFDELRAIAGKDGGREAAVVKEFLTLLAVCHTVIPEIKEDKKIVYQASSPDEAALVSGAELLGYKFNMRKPKSVFVEIQGVSTEFEILNVCEFNSTRKRMSTVVRGADGKIKLYCKGADTVILERLAPNQPYSESTVTHLEDYATEGLRTLCLAMREISDSEYRSWSAAYNTAAATINGRGDALDAAAELIEKDMFMLGATAIEDKLQEGVPDAIHTLQMAGIKIWVLTGDRQETAINIGLSCRLISESMNLVIVNEEDPNACKEFIQKRLIAIKNQRKTGEQEDLALVIDGKSLTFALEKPLSKDFLELAMLCKAVICCRVSPLQKALVVKLVKKNLKAILLAIGDGANDVSMIQAAHIGVGISGVEGLQAARSADVAISQFRFLKKLLLVHGAWSYQRLSKLILYSFYKNIVLYMTQFWFSFYNEFSGQIAYESWTLSFYNVIFTLLPPFVIGVFDQFVSARILDRYPQLYTLGQKNAFFTPRAFWMWILNALYHSVLLFGFSVILFWGDLKSGDGKDTGHWFWGTTLYLAVLLTVLGKAALISDLWTKYTVAAIPGSFLFTMVALPLYALVAPNLGFSTEYYGIVPRLWGDAIFWFTILLLPFVCLIRDYGWKYYRRTYTPASYHIAQELQKYNIPDYRPRQEQFQKAIKKVRAVQRMRRNRGFAFSQTEDMGKQDQARIIRAYDTSQSFARPATANGNREATVSMSVLRSELVAETAVITTVRLGLFYFCRTYLLRSLYHDLRVLSSQSLVSPAGPPSTPHATSALESLAAHPSSSLILLSGLPQTSELSDADGEENDSLLPSPGSTPRRKGKAFVWPPSVLLPRRANTPAVINIERSLQSTLARTVFATCFSESCILFLMLMLQAMGILAASQLGRRAVLTLVPYAMYLAAVHQIPVPEALNNKDLITTSLSRLMVIGVVILGLISGYGCISTTFMFFTDIVRSDSMEPSALEIAQAEQSVSRVRTDLEERRKEVDKRQVLQQASEPAGTSASWFGRFPALWRSGDAEASGLQREILGLEMLEREMANEVNQLKTRKTRIEFSRTWKGKLWKWIGWTFGAYCVFRILSSLVNLLLPHQVSTDPSSPGSLPPRRTPDLITGLVVYLLSLIPLPSSLSFLHLTSPDKIAAVARQVSLVLVGCIVLVSVRGVLRGIGRVLRLMSGTSTTRRDQDGSAGGSGRSLMANFMLLVLAQVMVSDMQGPRHRITKLINVVAKGLYLLSTLIQLRNSFTGTLIDGEENQNGEGVAVLFASLPSYEVFNALFDWTFLSSAGLTALGRWIGTQTGLR
ncbi:hypothetical protein FRB97_005434 [Tulasnella sp. 331]|nr:hypothetical protein FRB97_005434 [Tulasnella sp. 331]